ncbi:MAG: hypothetical protein AB7S44_00080 [Spirochaetales bacterium]
MIVTTNKIESANKIKELDLNIFAEAIFHKFDTQKILEFAEQNPCKYYCVRSKSASNSKKTNIYVLKEELVDYCSDMDVFSINVSSSNYIDNQTLSGEIMITSDMQISYSVSSKITSPEQFRYYPQFYGTTYVFDKKLNRINGIDDIVTYIFEHKLFDMVVEFSCFDINVGIKNGKTVIYELRTHY